MKKSLMVIASLAVAVAMVPVGHASAANITALDEGKNLLPKEIRCISKCYGRLWFCWD